MWTFKKLKWLAVVFCMMTVFASQAAAHDASFARWDLSPGEGEVILTLRTSGHGLESNLLSDDPTASDATSRRERLLAYFNSHIILEEDGLRLQLKDIQDKPGHETTVALVFERTHMGSARQLLLDLGAYSANPNQHNLVFVHVDDRRDRIMLNPESGYVLNWPLPAPTPQKIQQENK